MQTEGKTYPYAKHINTACNDKIKNLPENFNGTFVVEESYYETDGKSHASPHLFLISENNEGIVLSSYDIPNGEDKNTFSYDSMKAVDYSELNESKNSHQHFIARRMCLGRRQYKSVFTSYDI